MKSTGALCSRLKTILFSSVPYVFKQRVQGTGKKFDTDFIVLDQKRL